MTVTYAKCRCPQCGRIRGEAADTSQIRLQCHHCRILFTGKVINGMFKQEGPVTPVKPQRVASTTPPHLVG